MTDLRERRRQLLNLTITEIILIILFLVLLIAGSLIKKNKELRDQNQIYKNLDVDALQLAEFQKFKELATRILIFFLNWIKNYVIEKFNMN